MKETQILFTAPMVRALLAGTKTQTRRIVKPQPEWTEPDTLWQHGEGHSGSGWYAHNGDYPEEGALYYNSPYGQPGDRLIVRETFYAWGHWETRFSAKKKRDEWHFVDMTADGPGRYFYAADGAHPAADHRATSVMAWWKRPAIFMPSAASRILLEVTDVRVERLQDISDADARAEGARECDPVSGREVLLAGPSQRGSFVLHYRDLWERINGPGSWAANPWVWVIEFRREASP